MVSFQLTQMSSSRQFVRQELNYRRIRVTHSCISVSKATCYNDAQTDSCRLWAQILNAYRFWLHVVELDICRRRRTSFKSVQDIDGNFLDVHRCLGPAVVIIWLEKEIIGTICYLSNNNVDLGWIALSESYWWWKRVRSWSSKIHVNNVTDGLLRLHVWNWNG